MQLIKEKNLDSILITGGGIIPEDDIKVLKTLGVGELFSPGTNTKLIAEYIQTWVQTNRTF